MPQISRHVSIDALDPAQHTRRCIYALKAHSLQIQNRGQNRLNGNKVREQDLRNGVVRVNEGLEFVVRPAGRGVVEGHKGGVGFDGARVRGGHGADENVPVGAFPVGHVEVFDGGKGHGGHVEVVLVDAVQLRCADAAAHCLEVAVFAESLVGSAFGHWCVWIVFKTYVKCRVGVHLVAGNEVAAADHG